MRPAFRVGAATRDLTPSASLPNYNGQLIETATDFPLRCAALVFDDGERRGALVSCAVTFVDSTLVQRVRDECSRAAGLSPEWITVGATHTHAAPATCPSFLSGALPEPRYLDFFVGRVVEAVVEAKERLRPAVVAAGSCPAPGWEFNRRLLRPDGRVVMAFACDAALPASGPVDPEVPFIAFENEGGEPIAVAVSYASHNNCVGGRYHGDIAGCAAAELATELDESENAVPLLFFQGACADVMWRGGEPPPLSDEALARRIGADLVATLLSAWHQASRQEISQVVMVKEVLDIADRPWGESTFCHDGCRGEDEDAQRFARRRYDPEEEAVKHRGTTSCLVEIQGIAFGDAVFCSHPAELFAELGLAVRQQSPFAVTFMASLTNGYCGYVPTEEAFELQGYETHRTVYTSRLEKGAGRRIVDATVGVMESLHATRRS